MYFFFLFCLSYYCIEFPCSITLRALNSTKFYCFFKFIPRFLALDKKKTKGCLAPGLGTTQRIWWQRRNRGVAAIGFSYFNFNCPTNTKNHNGGTARAKIRPPNRILCLLCDRGSVARPGCHQVARARASQRPPAAKYFGDGYNSLQLIKYKCDLGLDFCGADGAPQAAWNCSAPERGRGRTFSGSRLD